MRSLSIGQEVRTASINLQEGCPKRVVFVLKETEPENWISNGGDFSAYLKPPGVEEVVDQVRPGEPRKQRACKVVPVRVSMYAYAARSPALLEVLCATYSICISNTVVVFCL